MPENTSGDGPPHLRGLDPASILGVLGEGPGAERPVIPGWKIGNIAGRGGLGVVWRAWRERDGRCAAIKVATGGDPDTVERIEEEAAALRALEHPNIVRLIESGPLDGPEEGGIFLAMEYVDGPSLAHLIPDGGLPPPEAYAIFRRIASAVSYAHGKGILHRDLKPGNILMAPTETGATHPMVADFGLARPVHQRVQHLSLTHAGLIAGTADYLPPEAYRAAYRPDTGGDIYALGVILYEMLTGGPPRGAWVPVARHRRVDIRVDEVIRRALEPDPARRWSGVDAMLLALEEVLATPPRYAGTPLLTFPVRVADCLWTLLGLGLLCAAGSTLARLAKSQVLWPPDLIGSHGLINGGFHALFFLLLASLPLALWLLARLWRFRRVPLREALPGPFGLQMPPTRTTALLVAAAQGLCLFGPAALLLHLFISTGLVWLRADDPPWVHGLAVTTTSSRAIHPLWERGDPGVLYWLRETLGPPEHPLSFETDRVDFFPGTMPSIMLVTGILLGLTVTVVFSVAVIQWWQRKKQFRSLSGLVPLAAFVTVAALYFQDETRKVMESRDPQHHNAWTQNSLVQQVRRFGHHRLAGTPITAPELLLYDHEVDYRDRGKIPRDAIPALLAAEFSTTPAGRQVTHPKDHATWKPDTRTFDIRLYALETTDPPGGPATATLLSLKLNGYLTLEGQSGIQAEALSRTPLYTADSRLLTSPEAAAWAAAFTGALTAPSGRAEALHPLLHPRQLLVDPKRSLRLSGPDGVTRAQLVAVLGSAPELTASGPCQILGPQPGGRTRLLLPLYDVSRRLRLHWLADLVRTDGQWTCVRLQFGDSDSGT